MPDPIIVSWFSAGVSSFVATLLARPDKILFIDIDDHHPDTKRYVSEASDLFFTHLGVRIETLQSPFRNVGAALRAAGAVRFPHGAPCTERLKRRPRKDWERSQSSPLVYVWGYDVDEKHRADRVVEAMPKQNHLFPLITNKMTKSDCHGFAKKYGLKRPAMYDLGYNNNNCVGCVKGGKGYWNKIRKDFPTIFAERAKLERELNASIINGVYLDELRESAGRETDEVLEDCGINCQLAFIMQGGTPDA